MTMSDKELDRVIQNDVEWRKLLWKEVAGTKKDLNDFKIEMIEVTTTLKIKIGIAGAFFGCIGGTIVTIVVALIK